MKIKEIKRKIRRSTEELRAAAQVAGVLSLSKAWATLRGKIDIQIMCRNGFIETEARRRHLLRKHAVMMEYLDKKYSDWLKTYKPATLPPAQPELEGKIWLCWWQGLENAPEIVKICVDSIRRNAHGREVIVITDKNYRDYVTFPAHIEQKVRDGIISKTFFSDILRLALLSRYGGMWLDATFYCTDYDLSAALDKPLWSIKRPDYLHCSPACGNFAGYSLACDTAHRSVMRMVLDFVYHYWEDADMLIDYLLMGHGIVWLQRHIPAMAEAFAAIEPNNRHCDDLFTVLSEPFDPKKWAELKNETGLFKLSWKSKHPLEADGHPTFYAKLLAGELV